MPTFAHGMWFASEEEHRLRSALLDLVGLMRIDWHQFTAVREGDVCVVELPREWAEKTARRLNAKTDEGGAFEVLWSIGRMHIVPSDALSTNYRDGRVAFLTLDRIVRVPTVAAQSTATTGPG